MKIHELSFYKDPKIFQLNELAYRSCFIPFDAVIHSRDPQNKRKTARKKSISSQLFQVIP